MYDLYLLVQPDVDLDDRFKAWDTDQQEWLRVNGWQFTWEEAEGHCAGPHDGIMRKED